MILNGLVLQKPGTLPVGGWFLLAVAFLFSLRHVLSPVR